MTSAERKAVSRANQEAKRDDAERRTLIAELMRIYRRQQSDIVDDPKRPKAVRERREVEHSQRRLYLYDLIRLSLAELQLTLEVAEQAPDTHGRLHNERSGEAQRSRGQSEIEKILGAKQHDSSYFEDQEQDPSMAAGFRVKPVGAAPTSFE